MPVSRTRRQHLSNLLFEGFVSRAHAGPSVVPGAFSGQGRIPIDAEACITFGTVRGWEASGSCRRMFAGRSQRTAWT